MVRFILWLLVLYIVLTFVRLVGRARRIRREAAADRAAEEAAAGHERPPEFLNIADAEFEDLPPGEDTPPKP